MNGHSRSRLVTPPYTWKALGLTVERYHELWEEQEGRCAICKRTEEEATRTMDPRYKYLVPDHNHRSGRVRGLLCNYCNSRVGFVESHLRGIVNYLRQYKEVT